VFLLSNGADGVDVLLDIPGTELAMATHAALQVHKVVRVANGSDALDDLLALCAEALVLVACRFDLWRNLREAWRHLCGTARPTLYRLVVRIVEGCLHLLTGCFQLGDGLMGSPLLEGHRRCHCFAQFMLDMEEVG